MPAPPAILDKVKKLLNLANSPNPNEAETARAMADKFIAKYNITDDELASLEPKEFYGENEKLFVTLGIVSWRQQLALAVATYFDCQIVQEELVPAEGIHQFNYFVYGDPDQVKDTQFVYHAFIKKVENLADVKCIGRGPIHIDSYCEGMVESIKGNIQMFGIEMPDIKKPLKKEEQAAPPNSKTITKSGPNKEEPTNKRVDVNSQSFIKDIVGYYRGVNDGKNLSLQDILELEVNNTEPEQIAGGQEACQPSPIHEQTKE
jgi:hypothetical protein